MHTDCCSAYIVCMALKKKVNYERNYDIISLINNFLLFLIVQMKAHLVEHPSEFHYYCKRVLTPGAQRVSKKIIFL